MDRFTVFFDANIFFSAAQTDLVMELYLQGLFRAKWSYRVHQEWITALLREKPHLLLESLEKRRDMMNQNAGDCLVTGFETTIESLTLPDPDDRHVLAAAIHAGAGLIVTSNLKNFPKETLSSYGIQAQSLDNFVIDLFDLNYKAVLKAAKLHRAKLKNPPKDQYEYLESLDRQGLLQFVNALEEYLGFF